MIDEFLVKNCNFDKRMTHAEALARYSSDPDFAEHVNTIVFMRRLFTLSELGTMLALAEELHQTLLADEQEKLGKSVLVNATGGPIDGGLN